MLSVSVDSPFVHKLWDENEISKMVGKKIPFTMLSDQTGDLGRLFDVRDEASGTELRGRFIIDPDGIIQAEELLTPPVGRNVKEVLRQIQAYQMVRETKGAEVAPAGWRPGKTTLKPSPELSGNIWKVWKVEEAFE